MSKTFQQSGLFLLPLILAAAYLNMGQSSCGGGDNRLKCQGVPVTLTFDATDGSTQSGTTGDDVILVLAGPAVISAGGGDDRICVIGPQDDIDVYGGHGNDQIWGGPGSSLLNGGPGEDAIRGEGGDDILDAGNDGEVLDWLDGGPGDDLLYGDAGLDVLIGGDGNDVLWSGDEGNILNGGDGYDIAYLCSDDNLQEIEQTVSMYANQRCKRVTDVEISPETLYADEIESGVGQSDTPYFSFVKFSTQAGVPGSTAVQFVDQWVGVGVVSEATPEGQFPESIREQLDFGPRFIPKDPDNSSEGVWIDGVIALAMESDELGWGVSGGVRDKMIERATCLNQTLTENIETMGSWSPGAYLLALQNVREDLEAGCGEWVLQGGGGLIPAIKRALQRLVELFRDIDDPMGTAFVVRLGVPHAYFYESIAPLLGTPQSSECTDGSLETVSAGCDPFLANPCEMKLNPGTLSQYASFCPSAPVLSGIGVRYPRVLEIPFERFGQGKWTVRFEF